MYIFVKFGTFGSILKKSATVATDFHFRSDYVITHICVSHADSIYVILTGAWCLEVKHDQNSRLTNLSSDTVRLIDKQSF
jgi:hypothetical protein